MVLNTFLRSLTLVFNLDSSRTSLRVRTTWPRGGGGGLLNKVLDSDQTNPLPFYIPLIYLLSTNGAMKSWYPFWVEPSCIGHCREYHPGINIAV